MSLRKITALVADDKKNNIRTSANGNPFVVVDCDACIEDGILYPAVRQSFFADKKILEMVKPGLRIELS